MRSRFLADYLDLLDGRLAAIRGYVATNHYEEARTAIFSLEAASGMLGAETLVSRLRELRSVVDVGPDVPRTALLARIEAEAADLRRRLESGEDSESQRSVL
jgi:hypothetical protein